MKLSNPKVFIVMMFLSAGIFISVAATKPSAVKIKYAYSLISDTGYFKNLQVLPKNISKDSLDKIMDGFKAALGVKCGFCHAFDSTTKKLNFASDEKEEKGIARYMIKMTRSIDSTFFNFEKSTRPDTITVVKCETCHHGNPHPDQSQMNENNEHHDHDMMPPGAQPDDSNHHMPPPPPLPADSIKQ